MLTAAAQVMSTAAAQVMSTAAAQVMSTAAAQVMSTAAARVMLTAAARVMSTAARRLWSRRPGRPMRTACCQSRSGRPACQLASWAGLTPTVHGSDRKVRHGHISKQGSVWLRWTLNQAAQTAKRSPDFAASYQTIARKRGKNIATIAIARKLLTRAWHLLDQMQAADTGTPAAAAVKTGGSPSPG
jgi:Transposase IS116/IS110/IS902 family